LQLEPTREAAIIEELAQHLSEWPKIFARIVL
jgi:hypothetical protein